MSVFDYDIGVIGGGAAGLTVSSGAAQLGAKTLLVEREPALGGDCLHFGCVPSKTLIKSAHVYHMMQRAAEFGLPSVDLAPVDFTKIRARIRSVIDTIQVHDSVERFCKLGVQVAFGAPQFSDEHSIQLNGKTISAKHWVIATGSSSSTPPFSGLENCKYSTNKEIFSLESLPQSLIVLGAGPIGVEMAQSFARLGSKVTVIQRSDQILSREDADMAAIAMESLVADGVTFYLGAGIKQVKDLGDKRQVFFVDQDGQDVMVEGSHLLVALGRKANIHGLGLDDIDIKVHGKGIRVDHRLRTNQSHIYAPGDVNGAYQFTHAAGYEGGIVVSNAIFHLPRKADYTWMPHATYSDPEIASIGMNEKAAQAAGIEYQVWTEQFAENDRALAEGEGRGKIKMLLDSSEKPIGVQVVGPRAGDLLGEWVAILNGKVKLSTIAGAVHPYPTLAEINKRVVGSYLSPKIFSPTIKKGLKFFFNLKGAYCDPKSDLT